MIHFQANTTQFAVYAAYLVYSLALEKKIWDRDKTKSTDSSYLCLLICSFAAATTAILACCSSIA